jgi:hypothetical protein
MSEHTPQVEWWTAQELANRWRLSPSQVCKMCKRGVIVAKRMEGVWRIHLSAIEAYEADGKPQPKPQPRRPDLSEFENVPEYV